MGGILGHSFCTGLAVLGGRMIAQKISVRTGKLNDHSNLNKSCFIKHLIDSRFVFTVTLIGGVVFLMFALTALVIKPVDESL